MYIVLNEFHDLEDNNYEYKIGKIFPYDGKEISEDRLKELSSTKNKMGIKLIKNVLLKDLDENQLVEYSEILGINVKSILFDAINNFEKNKDTNKSNNSDSNNESNKDTNKNNDSDVPEDKK